MIVLFLALGCSDQAINPARPGARVGPAISLDPEVLDFGAVAVGEQATGVVTISSVGTAALSVSDVSLPISPFTITSISGELDTLAPGESASVVVSYTPSGAEDSSWLEVASDDPVYPAARVDLKGTLTAPAVTLDPAFVAFGNIELPGSDSEIVLVENTGAAPLTVSSIVTRGDGFSTFFDALPWTIAAGAAHPLHVAFTPASMGTFDGALWVTTDAAAGVVSAPLSGSSGMPVAVCKVSPDHVDPNAEFADWIGHDSSAPDGSEITEYRWTLAALPDGSTAHMPTGDADRTGFWADLAGEYVASLVVIDSEGRSSAPCFATLTATPSQSLWVEMFWTHPSDDMDLHLLRPGGAKRSDGDCFYLNCVGRILDWGAPGEENNPSLDLDDIPHKGPENINIDVPEDGTYTVFVHDFPGHVYEGANDVTVRIYLDGSLAWTDLRTISGEDDDVLYATVDWPSGVITSQY